ncbi:MAG: zinc ABC transporter substrate-binding protein [Gammaproteobacteria bacterium]|nr:MAG: zinc ABC transporter substrate-binding protein [Gammaproteobacteria bacterium]
MRMMILLALSLLLTPFSEARADLRLTATLPPLTLMVRAIKPDSDVPVKVHTLITDDADPHDFHLRPSHIRLLQNSDQVIWGGERLEPHMKKILGTLPPGKIISLDAQPPALHFWLSPLQTLKRIETIAGKLGWPISETLNATLRKRSAELKGTVEMLGRKKVEVWVFHPFLDALETDYGLETQALTKGGHGLSALQMRKLEKAPNTQRCLIIEPEWKAMEQKEWVRRQFVKRVHVDPLFRGADSLDQMYTDLIHSLKACLTEN